LKVILFVFAHGKLYADYQKDVNWIKPFVKDDSSEKTLIASVGSGLFRSFQAAVDTTIYYYVPRTIALAATSARGIHPLLLKGSVKKDSEYSKTTLSLRSLDKDYSAAIVVPPVCRCVDPTLLNSDYPSSVTYKKSSKVPDYSFSPPRTLQELNFLAWGIYALCGWKLDCLYDSNALQRNTPLSAIVMEVGKTYTKMDSLEIHLVCCRVEVLSFEEASNGEPKKKAKMREKVLKTTDTSNWSANIHTLTYRDLDTRIKTEFTDT